MEKTRNPSAVLDFFQVRKVCVTVRKKVENVVKGEEATALGSVLGFFFLSAKIFIQLYKSN
jgi:hypothetical protein